MYIMDSAIGPSDRSAARDAAKHNHAFASDMDRDTTAKEFKDLLVVQASLEQAKSGRPPWYEVADEASIEPREDQEDLGNEFEAQPENADEFHSADIHDPALDIERSGRFVELVPTPRSEAQIDLQPNKVLSGQTHADNAEKAPAAENTAILKTLGLSEQNISLLAASQSATSHVKQPTVMEGPDATEATFGTGLGRAKTAAFPVAPAAQPLEVMNNRGTLRQTFAEPGLVNREDVTVDKVDGKPLLSTPISLRTSETSNFNPNIKPAGPHNYSSTGMSQPNTVELTYAHASGASHGTERHPKSDLPASVAATPVQSASRPMTTSHQPLHAPTLTTGTGPVEALSSQTAKERASPLLEDPIAARVQDVSARVNSAPHAQTSSATATDARMIAAQIASKLNSFEGKTTSIRLEPEELGQVRMTLKTSDHGVTLMIVAERQETSDLMRRHIQDLVDEFEAMGFASLDLSFGDQQQPNASPGSEKYRISRFETDAEAVPDIERQTSPERNLDIRL